MIIKEIKTGRALSPTGIGLADYVINPYTGCQYGCAYCYSRSNKNIARISEKWGTFVYVKTNLPELLEKEIQSHSSPINKVLIGSTTDPLQPAENKYKTTKAVLEILSSHNIPLIILTKSLMIKDYLYLFKYSAHNIIYLTYNSGAIPALFDNHNFSQEDRLEAMRAIRDSGTRLISYISPVFPELTDINEIFNDLRGKTGTIYFESYNIRQGNWTDIREKLDTFMVSLYEDIFFNEISYNKYWDDFKIRTDALNKKYGFTIKYFIHPFNTFY